MNPRRTAVSIAFLIVAAGVSALEIPVQRAQGKKRDAQVVAFVDMERVYQEFPETRKARQEYLEQADKMKQALADKAAELSDLREQLAVLRDASAADAAAVGSTTVAVSSPSAALALPAVTTGTTKGTSAPGPSFSTGTAKALSPGGPAASTATVSVPRTAASGPVNLQQREQTLAEEESALAQAKADAARKLAEFEKKRAGQIFGKLYTALVQLADERGVDIVLDKSSLLYGQGSLDLTEDLSRRVRGLPDPQ
jgi:Skp family chaperone for outer membrane proteins